MSGQASLQITYYLLALHMEAVSSELKSIYSISAEKVRRYQKIFILGTFCKNGQ